MREAEGPYVPAAVAAERLGLPVESIAKRVEAGIMPGRKDASGNYEVPERAITELLELRASLRRSAALFAPTRCYRCGHLLADEHDDQYIWDWHCRICQRWCEKAATWTPKEEAQAYTAYERDPERRALAAAAYEEALKSGALGSDLSNREAWRQDLARALADVRAGRVRPWSEVARVLRERYARPRSQGMSEEERRLNEAWADAQAIADGDTASGSWDHINAATERAVRRRRASWRFVIARGLRSLKDGLVKVWNKALDKPFGRRSSSPSHDSSRRCFPSVA
ncbi:MAG: hypothetical protein KGK34_02210 [Chloroflexota bacterium]|nr:hypothetical protein [Chloroflexota bacterium]